MIFIEQNRRLFSRQVGYSGEVLDVEVPGGVPGVNPADCFAIIYDVNRRPLAASGRFDSGWKATMDTATAEMSERFTGVLANTALALGFAVVLSGVGIVVGGSATIVSAPFPEELSPLPPGATDVAVRLSMLADLIKAGDNVTITEEPDGSLKISAKGGGTGTGISAEVAQTLYTSIGAARSISAIQQAVQAFCLNYFTPKATKKSKKATR